MPYVPTQFYAGNGTATTGDVVLYTVPAGMKAIVTDVTVGALVDISYYLYPGPSFLCYSKYAGASQIQQYQGFYVVEAGENMITANFTSGAGYQVWSGLLGSGDVAGKTPARLGTAAPTAGGDNVLVSGSPNGCIVKTILVQNVDPAPRAIALRHNSAPIAPWGGAEVLGSYENRQYDYSLYVPPGSNILANSMDGLAGARFSAHGWRL